MMSPKEVGPRGIPEGYDTNQTTTDNHHEAGSASDSTAGGGGFDLDKKIVDRVDESIWAAIYAGHFRLGVKCERCGRWLYDGRSKKRGMGVHCAAKAAAEAVGA